MGVAVHPDPGGGEDEEDEKDGEVSALQPAAMLARR
jgi:hypothetical protein